MADTVIVSSWAEMVTAIENGATDIKFSDIGSKYIEFVDITRKITASGNLTIDFNGWTIEEIQIATYTSSGSNSLFSKQSTIMNLTCNHLNVYKTAPYDIFMFYKVYSSYFYDIWFESKDSSYTNWGTTQAGTMLLLNCYDSIIQMRSQDYAPRIPMNVIFSASTYEWYNCEIGIDYKWTKNSSAKKSLFGCDTSTGTQAYAVWAIKHCYLHGKFDISEGTGTWQGTRETYGHIVLDTSIVNIEFNLGSNTLENIGVYAPAPGSGVHGWSDIPKKSLFVTNNGVSASTIESVMRGGDVYTIDGKPACVLRTLKEDLKNKDWLNDIAYSLIDDDDFRYTQYHGKVTPAVEWIWRKSDVINQAIPFLPFWKYPVYTPPPYYGDVPEGEYICIYDLTTKQDEFSGHGLAVLRPSSCRIVEELNGSYNLTLTHPRDKEGKWQYILEMNIIKALGQLFVIQRVDEVLTGNSYTVTAYAEHISYTLNDRWIFPPVTIAGYTGTSLMSSIINQSTDMGGDWQTNYTFSVSSDIDAPSDFRDWYEMPDGVTPYEMLLGSQGFIAKLGGELYRDNFQMIINERMYGAQDDAFELSIGYNLTGIKRTVDLTTFVTYLRCYDVSDGEYGTWWAVSWDPSTLPRAYPRNVVRSKNFTYDHEEYKEGQLERDGFAFWGQNCAPLITYELNVKDLKNAPEYKEFANNYRFKVGDKGRVWDERLQTWSDVEITRTEKDGITGETVKVIIGSQRSFTRPNSYNPITPVRINADKVVEGVPPITFMSDGGNLRHLIVYGKTEAVEIEGQTQYIGVGDIHHFNEGGQAEKMHYDLTTGEPDSRPYSGDYWAETEMIPVVAGWEYKVQAWLISQETATGEFQVLYYDANDNYLSYDRSSSAATNYGFMPPTNATQCMIQMYYPNGDIVNFDVYNYALPIVLTQFDERATYIPIGSPLYDGQNWSLENAGINVETWSGENTLTIPTTVIPRVKLTYKEPMNTSYERITQSITPITIYADGTNLMNWVIYGAEGGVGGTTDIFSGGVSDQFYDWQTGEPHEYNGYWSSNNLIPITEGVTYECIGVWDSQSTVYVGYYFMFFDSNSNFLSFSTGGGASASFTAPANAAYVRIEVGSTSQTLTNFILNAPALPVTVTQGNNSQTVVIPINAPLTENQSVSMESTGISIPTYNGQTTISVASQVQPTMKIQYMEKRS